VVGFFTIPFLGLSIEVATAGAKAFVMAPSWRKSQKIFDKKIFTPINPQGDHPHSKKRP
jgi:hypothetical protein